MANKMRLLIPNVLSKSHVFCKSNFGGRVFYCTTNQLEEITNEDDSVYTEEEINKFRNKSLLNEEHYDKLHDKVPHLSDLHLEAVNIKTLRELYARGGSSSNIDPSICWPSKEELQYEKDLEEYSFPQTIQEMLMEDKIARANQIKEREDQYKEMKKKIKELNKWKKLVNDKIAKRENDARLAKEIYQKRIEEVRQIFGYNIDPKDSRFQEALQKKEEEERRVQKAARKLEKQRLLTEKLKAQALEAQGLTAEDVQTDKLYGKSIVSSSLKPPSTDDSKKD